MSGIVGIVSLDGSPVDPRLVQRMTDSMAYRGPDDQSVWIDGSAGFGHTLLRTTIESACRQQPASLDGAVWITADARLDGRVDLVRQLRSQGRQDLDSANDAELILHAYHAWGEACVEHLLGDFAFAIWDGRARRLFCARDHFGVKPFYYTTVGGAVVFSNTLDCIRLHPGVSRALNDIAIGDFLVFGFNQDPTTTAFADVRRLTPAHSLTCGNGQVHLRRYWTLPTDGRVRYRRAQQYVDHFTQLLRAAVGDRLGTTSVGVWMSGGLDSTSIATIARQLLAERGACSDLRAHTTVYDTLIPDEERYYAGIAADALGIHTSYFVADDYLPLDGWDDPDAGPPEPSDDPFLRMRGDQLRAVASHSRVLLCGEGGDEIFWRSYVVDLIGSMPLVELGMDVARSLILHRRRPGAGLRNSMRSALRYPPRDRTKYPTWVNSAFAERVNLRARWEQVDGPPSTAHHALRPEAHRRLATAAWSWYFESCDPGVTRIPVECRYPLMDVRLVEYLLAIPPLPWCIDKQLLRVAMRGALPDRIRLRPKTALAGDPLRAHLGNGRVRWQEHFQPTPELAQCVDMKAVPQPDGSEGSDVWQDLRPLCLNHWLKRVYR